VQLPVEVEGVFAVAVHEQHAELVAEALVVGLLIILEFLGLLKEFTELFGEVLTKDLLHSLNLEFENV
jgi:hypothetical protein